MYVLDRTAKQDCAAFRCNAATFAEPLEDTANPLVSAINIYDVFKVVLREQGNDAALEAVALMRQGQVTDAG